MSPNLQGKKYEDLSDQELVEDASTRYAYGGGGNGALAELMNRLKNSIISLDKTTSFYSKWLVGLTIAIVILTILMLFKK